jgi:rare lipoprotein A (peptidoglycan hydrolase)
VKFTSENANAESNENNGKNTNIHPTNTKTAQIKTGKKIPTATIRGLASYYHNKFEGRKTANGEIFSQKLYTAAHKELPFGTLVKVTRLSNGKSVTVRINDRGPFVENRIIDLSYSAALEIDLINDGIAEVTLEIIQ